VGGVSAATQTDITGAFAGISNASEAGTQAEALPWTVDLADREADERMQEMFGKPAKPGADFIGRCVEFPSPDMRVCVRGPLTPLTPLMSLCSHGQVHRVQRPRRAHLPVRAGCG
jgi:hypothetical protein